MHSIKKAARRQAWYHNFEEAETKTYNFFGRVDTRRSARGDEESQLRRRRTGDTSRAPTGDTTGLRSPPEDRPPPIAELDNGGHVTAGGENSTSRRDFTADNEKVGSADQAIDRTALPTSGTDHSDGAKQRKGAHGFLDKFKKPHDTDRSNSDDLDAKPPKHKITAVSMFKVVLGSWINLLLVFVPIGIALNFTGVNKVVVFVLNFVAIIPLAAMLSYSTEELALYIGEVMGGLLNATFGNAVELIVGVIALKQGKTLIVQTSLIGSMLSNLLLVVGMCFFFGGLRRTEQYFNITVAQTAASLLALAIGSLVIPTAFKIFETSPKPGGVTHTSRGTALILLAVYAAYLFFQLHTHVDMYNEPGAKSAKKPSKKKEQGEASKGIATIAASQAASAGGSITQENLVQEPDDDDDPETPQLTIIGALVTLAVSTVLIALCAEYMVSSINAVANHVSQEFIGLILLPIVGNAAEHATAVTVAIKDKMDLSIGVAVGSSLQIALLVLPFMIMLNWWGVGSPADLTLDFDGFQVSVLFIAIILVNYVVQDGKSNWLDGAMLQATYLIIAVSAWFFIPAGEVAG